MCGDHDGGLSLRNPCQVSSCDRRAPRDAPEPDLQFNEQTAQGRPQAYIQCHRQPLGQTGNTDLDFFSATRMSHAPQHQASTQFREARDWTTIFDGFTMNIMVNGGERVRTDDPLLAKQVLSQLSYTPANPPLLPVGTILVGQGGFEPPTPRLSSVCSNQLSY